VGEFGGEVKMRVRYSVLNECFCFAVREEDSEVSVTVLCDGEGVM
jgi:hypothetical protein